MATLFAGTSGFAYPSWKPDFYPPKLPAKDFLKHYATRLNAVEINYTFRQLPKATTLENWVNATPEGFIFCLQSPPADHAYPAAEGIRVHRGVLQGDRSAAGHAPAGSGAVSVAAELQGRSAHADGVCEKLPEDIRCAFEFRNKSWLIDEVYRLFEKHGIALCLAESDKFEVPEVVTAGFVYVRLRKEDYSPEERAEIADAASRECWRAAATSTCSSSTKTLPRGLCMRRSC